MASSGLVSRCITLVFNARGLWTLSAFMCTVQCCRVLLEGSKCFSNKGTVLIDLTNSMLPVNSINVAAHSGSNHKTVLFIWISKLESCLLQIITELFYCRYNKHNRFHFRERWWLWLKLYLKWLQTCRIRPGSFANVHQLQPAPKHNMW